jgi:alpha-tubulin suppressor-like RCC1 family protein
MIIKKQTGFMLPIVMVLSITIIAAISTLLLLTSSSYQGSNSDHYQKLADEAAEAGSAYATACLNLSSHIQTWGPKDNKNPLSPSTDCNGINSYSINTYVYNDSSVRSYFTVPNLDYGDTFSTQISSTGTAEVLQTTGTVVKVVKTYTSTQKKIITWPTDVTAQMSASGTNRTCAIVTFNVYCWGYNRYGQLGNGAYLGRPSGAKDDESIGSNSTIDSVVPVKVKQEAGVMAGKKIKKIFVAQYHSCALSLDNLMFCWGYNGSGQLGTGNLTDSPVPVQVKISGLPDNQAITDIGGTNNTTCAIVTGKIYCWGANGAGQLGIGVSGNRSTPTLVSTSTSSSPSPLPASYNATSLSTSGSRAQLMCAIADTKAYCWGQNDVGSVGDGATGSTNNRYAPTKVNDGGVLSGKVVTTISLDGYIGGSEEPSTGFGHVCAVAGTSNGTVISNTAVYCWGENASGQLGNASITDSSVPVAVRTNGVLSGKIIQDVKVGLKHSCALASDGLASGGVYCWGYNASGQVGDSSNTSKAIPYAVTLETGNLTASNVISIGAGGNRGCAVITDGRTFCWGLNTTGQIGDGTQISRNKPTESLFLRPLGNQYIF